MYKLTSQQKRKKQIKWDLYPSGEKWKQKAICFITSPLGFSLAAKYEMKNPRSGCVAN